MKLPHHCLIIFVCLSLLLCSRPAVAQALDYTYTSNNGAVVITKYIGSGGAVTIPGAIAGLPVTGIGDGAFAHIATVLSVSIPDSVTNIGDHAFDTDTSLTSVAIPNSVTNIGDNAFACCTSLSSVTIPDSVTNIGDNAFTFCTSLMTVTIGNSVASIGTGAFTSCTGLAGIHFHGNAPGLGERVFNGANNATISYQPGTKGWGTQFGGRPTAPWKQ